MCGVCVCVCRKGDYGDLKVAIKLLKEAVMESDSEAVAEFDREVRLLRTLRHPNVVFFLGAGSFKGIPFLVTEVTWSVFFLVVVTANWFGRE